MQWRLFGQAGTDAGPVAGLALIVPALQLQVRLPGMKPSSALTLPEIHACSAVISIVHCSCCNAASSAGHELKLFA